MRGGEKGRDLQEEEEERQSEASRLQFLPDSCCGEEKAKSSQIYQGEIQMNTRRILELNSSTNFYVKHESMIFNKRL